MLRAALSSRSRKMSMATMARDLGFPMPTLEGFINGADLAPDVLQALTKIVFPNATYDPARDLLVSPNSGREAKSYVAPPPFVPTSPPAITGGITLPPVAPAPKKRGWA